jgi:hypothetical protein
MLCLRDDQARPTAARHHALLVDTIIELLDDPTLQVAMSAAANPSLPCSGMEALLNQRN